MTKNRRNLTVALVVAGSAIALGSTAVATRNLDNKSTSPVLFSAKGKTIHLSRAADRRLRQLSGGQDPRLVGVRGGHAFYRIGDNCFAVGASASIGALGVIKCWGEGQSVAPIIDFSIVEITREQPDEVKLIDVTGFAADGIAAIGLRTAQGTVATREPVTNNLYAIGSLPNRPIVALVAFDRSGTALYSTPLR
jgi:hypothetical protein